TLFAAVIGMTIMSSCKKDEEFAAPTITLNPSVTSTELDFAAGDSVISFSARIQAEAEIESFAITEIITDAQGGGTSPYDAATTDGFKGETDKTYDFSKTFSPTDFATATKYEYKFDVTDKDGQTYSLTYSVTQGTAATPINTYLNKTIVSAYLSATAGSQYMDATTGVTYRYDATGAENATFGFISGGGSGADILCSGSSLNFSQKPASWATGAKLATTSLTAAEFDAITDETALLAAMPASISLDDVQGLNTTYYAVLAFEDGGKKGLIKLPSSFTNAQDQSIVISVKVQQ
ncbi:MAG: hypothetical protein J7L46_07105, partial [Bacteroidales bacterium]|nr:hypothetical protein [Bacteroidales bacterium]